MSFLEIEQVSKQGSSGRVLSNINFSQQKLQHVAIAGETGSGKSTLMKIIAGLIQPDSGRVIYKNEIVKGPEEQLVPGHPDIAYLSQHFELPKFLKVAQVLTYASSLPEEEAENLYATCRISHLLDRKTDQLSGGERQRIALARLLSTQPGLLILDEPFSNLDMEHKKVLKSVVADISGELNITCILISHDPADLLPWADEIIIMRNGEIVQHGSPEHVYHQPNDKYVAGLLGNFNLIPAEFSGSFCKWTELSGKDMIIRPEHLQIATQTDGKSLEGEVIRTRFFGNYYKLDLMINQVPLSLNTAISTFSKGEKLYVRVSPDKIWFTE